MKLSNISNSIINRDNKIIEIVAFILYIAGIACLMFFHEPWFDEFQALQISKATIHDILLVIPHSEGHPPLWHLILKFTSLFTSNPELCVKIPNIIFSSMAAWLLIFKSPFNKITKITLPFTYFIFYQYGVISRPYSILMFALFLIAYLYQNKNERPFLFGLSLGLLCLSSCYGIILAFAITLTWLIEIWNKQKFATFIKSFIKDKRFYSMLFLLLLCLFIFFEIYPVQNDIALSHISNCPLYQRILYCLFGMISDATFSDIVNPSNVLAYNILDYTAVAAMCCGAYITYLLFKYFFKSSFLLFTIMYSLWIVFIFTAYFSPHHIGILTLILIFNFWCSYFSNSHKKIEIDKYLRLIICITIIVQLYWSISAFINEIRYNYTYGKPIATYIKNNNIAHNYKLFCYWYNKSSYFDENEKEIVHTTEITEDNKIIKQVITKNIVNYQPFAIEINTYFLENIFYNFNVFNPNIDYTLHADSKDISKEKVFNKWKSYGTPDIILLSSNFINFRRLRIEYPELQKVKTPFEQLYGDDFDVIKNYVYLKSFEWGHVWKALYDSHETNMYIKKSLYKATENWT